MSISGEFTAALVRGQGVQGIADLLQRHTGMPVTIADAEGRVVASSPLGDPRLVDADRLPSEHTGTEAPSPSASRGKERWYASAFLDREELGIISLYDPDYRAEDPELFALEQAASILAMELLRERSVAETQVAVWGDFITELLENPDDDQVRLHASRLGHDLDKSYRVILVQPTAAATSELVNAVRRAARWLGLGECMTTTRPEGIVMLVPEDVDWNMLSRLVVTDRDGGLRIGVGGRYGYEELYRSLVDARLALSLTKHVPAKPVAAFDDLGAWCLLARFGAGELRNLVEHSIGALIDYDRDHHSELVKTLTTYLNDVGPAEAVAHKLFIHRNTLNYRLARVKELTGCNLSDPDQRFELQLACRAWIVLGMLGAPS
jgi:PucR C-terminal helix-turn-helix domain/GGDEF-like domain